MIDTNDYDFKNIQSPRLSRISKAASQLHLETNLNSGWDETHAHIISNFTTSTRLPGDHGINDYGQKAPLYYHAISAFLWTLISASGIVYSIAIADPVNKDGIVFGGILWILSVGSIILDALPDETYGWKSFQVKFEKIGGYNGLKVYAIGCFCTALAAWIIISIEEDDVIAKTTAVEALIWISFYLGVLFLILCILSGWELISYYCATVSWLQGFMWISIIGAIVLQNARLLRPPPEDKDVFTWHRHHDKQQLIDGILFVLNLSWLAFVVLTCLFVPIFAEVSRWAADIGVEVGILIFLIFAFIITLNPIAPGTAIDVCGGFIFVILFMDGLGWGFFESWGVGLVIIIIIHYVSACMQWVIGKVQSVQLWMNRTAPIFILAASDAVLGDAGWFKTGLVGYVFLDTLNGLNQGRINMEFWTQLLSEWSCVPAAISLSALGASIGVQGDNAYSWTSVAVPMLIIMSGLVAAFGSIAGAAELGNSTDKKGYWHNREKWCIVQHFLYHGLACTEKGWEMDIYQIASSRKSYDGEVEITEDQLNRSDCLLARIYPLQLDFIAKRQKATSSKEKSIIMREFQKNLTKERDEHYEKIKSKVDEYVKLELMVDTHEPEESDVTHDFFADAGDGPGKKKWKLYIQYAVIISLIISFWGGIFGFFWKSDTAEAVEKGVAVFKEIDTIYWVALAWFGIGYNLYIYRYWVDQVLGIASTIRFMLGGCQSHGSVETRFAPIPYTVPEHVERRTLVQLRDIYGKDFAFVDQIEHKKNLDYAPISSQVKVEVNMSEMKEGSGGGKMSSSK